MFIETKHFLFRVCLFHTLYLLNNLQFGNHLTEKEQADCLVICFYACVSVCLCLVSYSLNAVDYQLYVIEFEELKLNPKPLT